MEIRSPAGGGFRPTILELSASRVMLLIGTPSQIFPYIGIWKWNEEPNMRFIQVEPSEVKLNEKNGVWRYQKAIDIAQLNDDMLLFSASTKVFCLFLAYFASKKRNYYGY